MSVQVIVNNKPIAVYNHESKNYVEGRKGSEFSIKITNPFNYRVSAVLSVDGISVIDGKPASDKSQGYLLQAYGSITIPGWTLDNTEVAKFIFNSKEKSYAALSDDNSVSNVGVIGCLFFKEKAPVISNDILRGITTIPFAKDYTYFNGFTQDDTIKLASASNSLSNSVASANYMQAVSNKVEQEIGTGFGDASEFKTKTVEFERGDIVSTIVVYYDSKKNLIDKGVIKLKKESKEPNPFPGMGCKPPTGWSRS